MVIMVVPPRMPLVLGPTPILKLERLSRDVGTELYVKRDDLTGLVESGNTVRKLEFLLAEALGQGADTLIACGSVQSSCCRTVAAVGARLGLRVILAINGERPRSYDGNLLLDRLLGAEVRYLSHPEWERADEVCAEMAEVIRGQGGRPYLIPESGSNEVGALGYLECAVELAEQIAHGAPRFDTVVISAFSGGSQAGLLMGKQLAGLAAEIVGVPIAWPAERVRSHITHTVTAAIRRFGLAIDVPKRIRLLDGYQGSGRGHVAEQELATVLRLAGEEGVLLDPISTGKAFCGLLDVLRRDAKALGQRVCFVHTGGIFSLFAHRDALSRLLDGATAPPR
jgi:D-cysteine desulfhydrase